MGVSASLRRAGSAATVLVAGAAVSLWATGPATAAASYRTDRVSVSGTGRQADDAVNAGDLSGDGRYVVFESGATTLVPGDTNGVFDIFLRDRRAGTTTRLTVAPGGRQTDGDSFAPVISTDGRFVAFASTATNLVPGPAGESDVYLLDRRTGKLDRISETPAGTPGDGWSSGASISGDGRYVTFETSAANLLPGKGTGNVALYDRRTGRLSTVNVEDGGDGLATEGSYWASISDNGRFVAYVSGEPDMVPADTNGVRDVFVRDLVRGTTVRASSTATGGQTTEPALGPDVTDDGRFVTFWSEDATLVPGDTNGGADAFLRDLRAGTTRALSATAAGVIGDSTSSDPRITPDGRYATYSGAAGNLVAGDVNQADDVFVTDLRTGTTILASRRTGGAQADSFSFNPRLTPDGRYVVYGSWATDLVRGDTNDQTDLFVTRLPG
jgi:TolB protein